MWRAVERVDVFCSACDVWWTVERVQRVENGAACGTWDEWWMENSVWQAVQDLSHRSSRVVSGVADVVKRV